MKIDRNKNTKINIIFGYIQKLLTVVFPFIIRTIIINPNILGIQYIGLNSLFSAVLNILNLADLGFGTAMVFSMYKPIAEDDTETINALLNLYRKIYKVVGIIVLVVGLAIMPALPYLIEGTIPEDINIYALYAIYLANNVIGYLFFAYKNSLFSAHQRNDLSSKIDIIIKTLMYAIQIAVLLLFKNYYVYIIFLPLSTLCINLYTAYKTKKMFPQYVCKGILDKEIKKDIKKKITALFTHRIGSVIQSSIDTICISAFLGLGMNGIYNNYMYIITAIEGFITIIKQSMLAGIGNSLIVESKEYNKQHFYKLVTLFNWIAIFCATSFMCLFQPFMQLWGNISGDEKMLLPLTVVICLVSLFYGSTIRTTTGLYKDALGMWWEDRFKPLGVSLFNLIGTIIFAYFGCFEGIILTTLGAYILVGLPWETHIFFKNYMEEKPTKYYFKQFLHFILAILSIAITYFASNYFVLFLKNYLVINIVVEIIIKALFCLILPNIIILIGFLLTKQVDKDLLKKGLKIMGKIKKVLKKCYYKLPHILRSEELRTINKEIKTYNKLKKKYEKYIDPTIQCDQKPSKYVFVCWLQGEENAPTLVKTCIKSMRENLKDRKIVVITSKNMDKYIEFPEYIITKWNNGIITNTHLSDILRVALLAKYGGLWIDATVLCTGDITRYINKDTELFAFSNEHRRCDTMILSSWLIYSKPNNPLIVNTLTLLYKYWEKQNKLCHYFLFHMLFTICARKLPKEWDKVPYQSNINPHIILFHYFFNTYDKQGFETAKSMSNFHKLSYKFKPEDLKENSFYQNLIEGTL